MFLTSCEWDLLSYYIRNHSGRRGVACVSYDPSDRPTDSIYVKRNSYLIRCQTSRGEARDEPLQGLHAARLSPPGTRRLYGLPVRLSQYAGHCRFGRPTLPYVSIEFGFWFDLNVSIQEFIVFFYWEEIHPVADDGDMNEVYSEADQQDGRGTGKEQLSSTWDG